MTICDFLSLVIGGLAIALGFSLPFLAIWAFDRIREAIRRSRKRQFLPDPKALWDTAMDLLGPSDKFPINKLKSVSEKPPETFKGDPKPKFLRKPGLGDVHENINMRSLGIDPYKRYEHIDTPYGRLVLLKKPPEFSNVNMSVSHNIPQINFSRAELEDLERRTARVFSKQFDRLFGRASHA